MKNQLMYLSTNKSAPKVCFKDALLKGLAPDKGLYMPENFPTLSTQEIDEFAGLEYHEIAYSVLKKFLHTEIEDSRLASLTKDAYNFLIPLERVVDKKYVMRLDQGPTASFKDFAARMMARLMQYYLEQDGGKLVILVATSGDTGSAIANAFYGLENIEVVVLFPKGEVSDRQRKQMTTLGKNVQVISLDGKFDDCQALVKEAFMDQDLKTIGLSSANSINIGRLLPQSVYYTYAYAKLKEKGNEEVVFSVPCGNFGNVMGGMIAGKMGVNVKKFIIATNENDEVPKYLESETYQKIEPSKNCISNAMNVGHPSNLSRIIDLYRGLMDETGLIKKDPDMSSLRENIYATSVNDIDTRKTIESAYAKYNLLLEPHGAVGWAGVERFLKDTDEVSQDQLIVSLETAHPAKFPDQIKEILSIDPKLPPSLQGIEDLEEKYLSLSGDYKTFKKFLSDKYL